MTKEKLFIRLTEALSDESLFFGHGVIDAQDEAMMVLMHVLNQSVEEILSSGDDEIAYEDSQTAQELIQQRLQELKPMAYIIGEVSFAGLVFKTDERALVPRSPIAELILNDFQPWVDIKQVRSALDLCTGSGCIGIALAKYNPHIQVDVSDISQEAIELAQTNIDLHLCNHNVRTIQSDLFENLTSRYDLIVTNPPYVSESEYSELPQEYKKEPKLGLTTPQDGLQIPVEIMMQAPKYLNDGGYLFLEVGYTDELLDDAFPAIDFEWIDFESGGQGVCVLSKNQLISYSGEFEKFLSKG
jgi:ribosomal protein L3 glutamine methyltransferase